MKSFSRQPWLPALAVALALVSPASPQASYTAVLRGTVIDPAKAAIPGAQLTITNDATQVSEQATTDEQGRYIFTALQPAAYTIRVEAKGFKAVVRPNVVLRVGQKTDLDISLEIGAVTTAVEVVGGAPLLDTASSDLGQTVDNKYVTEVPLFNRNIANLTMLTPGVTEVSGGTFNTTNPAGTNSVNFSSNGQRESTAVATLDGSPITHASGQGGTTNLLYSPLPEIVQEFKVQNANFSAEYGNNGGTVINIVSKSGTNEFHGAGYYFFRRPGLDATNFFTNRAGQKKPVYQRDKGGGMLSGPIIREKTFFVADLERDVPTSPATMTTSVPTPLEKKGDFSQSFNANGTLKTVFDPATAYQDAGGTWKRLAFGGNTVPASRMDPIGLRLAQFYPEPTGAGAAFTRINNFTASSTTKTSTWQGDVKVDHELSRGSRLTARWGMRRGTTQQPVYWDNEFNPAPSGNRRDRVQNGVVQHTWLLTASSIWTNRLGVQRTYAHIATREFDPTTAGLPAILVQPNGPGVPTISVSGYSNLGPAGSSNTISGKTVWDWHSAVTKVAGGHNLKAGGTQRYLYQTYWQPTQPFGAFSFSSASTQEQIFTPSATQGNGLASLLLGWGSSGGINIQPGTATLSKESAFYVQDDWRVTTRLTLNLGLRYEWSTPVNERYNRFAIPDFNLDTGVSIAGRGQIRGGLVPLNGRIPSDRNNLAPRIGLAHRLNEKTVLRAAGGVYYGLQALDADWLVSPTLRKYATWYASLDSGITRYATLADPFPRGNLYPQGARYGKLGQWGFDASTDMEGSQRNAEIFQWNVSLQRQVTQTLMLQAAYVGARSNHLPLYGVTNKNFIAPEARALGTAGLNRLVPNPFYPLFVGPSAIFDEPDSRYANPTIQQIYLLRPYPQFAGSFGGFPPFGANASYRALQLSFEKRYSKGLSFVGSYTYSRNQDDSSAGFNAWLGNSAVTQDPNNYRGPGEWGISGSDTPHRLVAGFNYELPIGRGRALGRGFSRPVNVLAGGWQITGFLTVQRGLPFNVGYALAQLADGNQRPNVNGDPRSSASIQDVLDNRANFFNLSAFSGPPPQQLGNAPRYHDRIRGDGSRNLDLGLFKNFEFTERTKLQFRAEFFNAFNTPRFNNPGSSFGSNSFGMNIGSQKNEPRLSQMGLRFIF